MKSVSLILLVTASLLIPFVGTAADIADATGTWSGNWNPKGGVMDALTVEIHQENGKLTGRFRTPTPMDFTKATFDTKSGSVSLEATDAKSGKHYKIDGKLNGNEIKGTMAVGETTGDLLLIKWTYIPR